MQIQILGGSPMIFRAQLNIVFIIKVKTLSPIYMYIQQFLSM